MRKSRKPFTPTEDDELIKLAGLLFSPAVIAQRMHREAASIRARARILGVELTKAGVASFVRAERLRVEAKARPDDRPLRLSEQAALEKWRRECRQVINAGREISGVRGILADTSYMREEWRRHCAAVMDGKMR